MRVMPMQFSIKNRWTNAVQFTADIECAEDTPNSLKIALAVKWGIKNSTDLRSADLRSADLRSADLRSANLESANLESANLRWADLRSANLESANLRWADLRSAHRERPSRMQHAMAAQ